MSGMGLIDIRISLHVKRLGHFKAKMTGQNRQVSEEITSLNTRISLLRAIKSL